MPVQHLRRLIGNSAEFKALRARAQRLEALQQAYVDYVPAEFAALTTASRVGYIKAGTLYVLADNAAIAAKLRHLQTSLVTLFKKLEPEVTGIKVLVQAKIPYPSPWGTVAKKPPPVGIEALFERLSRTVTDPGLRSALAKFGKKPI